MTLLYFKRRIDEELEGAKNYAQDAISMKDTRPTWAKKFAEMSEAELGHANKLLDMFHAYYAESFPSGASEQMEDVRADMLEEYTRRYSAVLRQHEIFRM